MRCNFASRASAGGCSACNDTGHRMVVDVELDGLRFRLCVGCARALADQINNLVRDKVRKRQTAVICSVCLSPCKASTAHLHQGRWIGDECCWDERLRASE